MNNRNKEYQERLELFNKYKNTAYNIAHKYAGNPNDLDDLIQVALMELWECTERYEKEKGVKFITYSTNCIVSRVKGWKWERCGIGKEGGPIFRLSILILQNKDKDKEWIFKEWEKMRGKKEDRAVFWNVYSMVIEGAAPLEDMYADQESGYGANIKDKAVDVEQLVENKDLVRKVLDEVDRILKRSNQQTKNIYYSWMRKMMEGSGSMQDVADEYGVSKQRVAQIVDKVRMGLEKKRKVRAD